jgi:hypothetical protein
MLHLLVQEKVLRVNEADNWQINGYIFTVNRLLLCVLWISPTPHLDVGNSSVTVRGGQHG